MVPRLQRDSPPNAHNGRGLCRRCYNGKAAALDAPPRWRALDLLAEYEFWLGQGMTTKRQVAERLGVTFKTLDRAISRGRAYRRRAAEVEQRAGDDMESEAA